jgi:hypothetical protein
VDERAGWAKILITGLKPTAFFFLCLLMGCLYVVVGYMDFQDLSGLLVKLLIVPAIYFLIASGENGRIGTRKSGTTT